MGLAEKSILIVDDMKTTRIRLRKICKDMGFGNIFEAGDGKQALDMLDGMKVDLVLSDWNMPHLTGIELAAKIKENPKLSSTPVIFITSENEKGTILKSAMAGVVGYVIKPFADSLVKEKILAAIKD